MVWAKKKAGMGGWLASVAMIATATASSPALAQTKRFNLDLFQGPLLAPSDIMGIAGAYAGYAEGIAGIVSNAAAPAVRPEYSLSTFEIDGSASLSIPIKITKDNNDFDNSGARDLDYSDFWYATFGGLIQYDIVGIGASGELQRYALTVSDKTTNVFIGKYHVLGALRLVGDQLMIGAGARLVSFSLDRGDVGMFGAAPEIGVLVRPDFQSFRLGLTLRYPVEGKLVVGKAAEFGVVAPDTVVMPWEIEAGVAVQVGPRPLNPVWTDPRNEEADRRRTLVRRRRARVEELRRELASGLAVPGAGAALGAAIAELHAAIDEERRVSKVIEEERRARSSNWPREHLLLTFSLLVTGPVDNGRSVSRFLSQELSTDGSPLPPLVSGATTNFSARVGVQAEPIPGRVHTRVGTYYEPSRYGARVGRQHFTFGADVRLFTTTWFGLVPPVTYKAQAFADLSPRYQSVSLGLGVWH